MMSIQTRFAFVVGSLAVSSVYLGCGPLAPCSDAGACISELDIQVNRPDGTQARNFRGTVADYEVVCSSDGSVTEQNCENDRVLLEGYGDDDYTSIQIDLQTTGDGPSRTLERTISPDWRENGPEGDECPTCHRASETVVLE